MEDNCNSNTSSKFKRVCVFCGSNPGYRQVFSDAAIDLGNELVCSTFQFLHLHTPFSSNLSCFTPPFRSYLIWVSEILLLLMVILHILIKTVKRKIDLVYGGGSVGLMGLISSRVYDAGCHVLGIIPKALVPVEISGESVGEVRLVADMHERKAEMARESEAFIALPGGYGTMEETLEMITWAQLGIHKKPVGLLNVDGYYDCLLQLFDNGVKEGFIKPGARSIVVSAPSAQELLTKMEQFVPSCQHVAPPESWQMQQLGEYPSQ